MGIVNTETTDILRLVAGVLHIGNIQFMEKGNYSQVADKDCKLNETKFSDQMLKFNLTKLFFFI